MEENQKKTTSKEASNINQIIEFVPLLKQIKTFRNRKEVAALIVSFLKVLAKQKDKENAIVVISAFIEGGLYEITPLNEVED
jgi:hypothetical protein